MYRLWNRNFIDRKSQTLFVRTWFNSDDPSVVYFLSMESEHLFVTHAGGHAPIWRGPDVHSLELFDRSPDTSNLERTAFNLGDYFPILRFNGKLRSHICTFPSFYRLLYPKYLARLTILLLPTTSSYFFLNTCWEDGKFCCCNPDK